MADTGKQNPQVAQGQFTMQRIYTKDVSLETPNSPAVFTQQWQPKIDVQLNYHSQSVAQDLYEVVVAVTVTATHEEKTAFLVEVNQAGLFGIKGFQEQQLSQVLGAFCPNILFPYAREAISDLVSRAGFPQLLLAPVNFDQLYLQRMQQQQVQGDKVTVQ